MADFAHFDCLKADALIEAQLGDTFLSGKHLDYMAATAELVRTQQAA